jgi:hypothetical protein
MMTALSAAGEGTLVEVEEEDGGVVALGGEEDGGGGGDRTTIVDMDGVGARRLGLQKGDGFRWIGFRFNKLANVIFLNKLRQIRHFSKLKSEFST